MIVAVRTRAVAAGWTRTAASRQDQTAGRRSSRSSRPAAKTHDVHARANAKSPTMYMESGRRVAVSAARPEDRGFPRNAAAAPPLNHTMAGPTAQYHAEADAIVFFFPSSLFYYRVSVLRTPHSPHLRRRGSALDSGRTTSNKPRRPHSQSPSAGH